MNQTEFEKEALRIFEEIGYENHISIANALRDYILKDLAENNPPVAIVDADDDGYWADILPDRSVKVGQQLYAKPAEEIINAVKAQALRDFADAQDAIRGGVGLLPFELRRMADELEKKQCQ